jgi:hypothetical protein
MPLGRPLVRELGHEVAVFRRPVHTDDRQQHGAPDPGPVGRYAEPLGRRREEVGRPVPLDRRRVRHVDNRVDAGQRRLDSFRVTADQIHSGGPGQLDDVMARSAGGSGQRATDQPGRAGDGDCQSYLPARLRSPPPRPPREPERPG